MYKHPTAPGTSVVSGVRPSVPMLSACHYDPKVKAPGLNMSVPNTGGKVGLAQIVHRMPK